MTPSALIKNANIVNEGKVLVADLRISDQRISRVDKDIPALNQEQVIDANGLYCCQA